MTIFRTIIKYSLSRALNIYIQLFVSVVVAVIGKW